MDRKQYNREYYLRNLDAELARAKVWRDAHPKEILPIACVDCGASFTHTVAGCKPKRCVECRRAHKKIARAQRYQATKKARIPKPLPTLVCVRCQNSFEPKSATGPKPKRCADCHATYNKEHYARNPKYHRARAQTWRAKNPERAKATTKAWRENNRERFAEMQRAWFQANKDRRREYRKQQYALNKEQENALSRLYKEKNREQINAERRAFFKAHPETNRYKVGMRRAAVLRATPAWANKEAIKQIYEQALDLSIATGIVHEVDHLYPLKSDWCCGLHVENNLQIIPKSENRSKKNRRIPLHDALEAQPQWQA